MESRLIDDEQRRVEVLRSYRVLDTAPEEAFDNITRLAAEICAMPVALISLVDDARQWFKARVGMELPHTPREVAFCAHAITTPGTFVVSDACSDPRFADNSFVTGETHIRFYAGVPLVSPEGCALGTLCVMDRVARELAPRELRILEGLARQVEGELELRRGLAELRQLCQSRPTLPSSSAADEPATGVQSLRHEIERVQREKDMLTELLVHDLKGPLMGVLFNATLLGQAAWADARTREITSDIETSALSMQRLVMNLLDIGRSKHGRLVPRMGPLELAPFLAEVASAMRLRARLKEQIVLVDVPPERLELAADRDLLRRVLENLIDNALKYSPTAASVTMSARRGDGCVRLVVADPGPGIEESDRFRIFDPFTRLEFGETCHVGHGLGLTFCKLAVDAHAGRLWVEPNEPTGARFCVELPCP
ncbi:MAG TPA: ATP-binding protein [Polyangiaceae bacterium]|nr:ATP-binding protein [Polyangiaceae bacterium]